MSSRAERRLLTTTDPPATPTADLHDLPALLTVAETAEVLRVGRSWVYEHAAELGAVSSGAGRRRRCASPVTVCSGWLGRPLRSVPGGGYLRRGPAKSRHRTRVAAPPRL